MHDYLEHQQSAEQVETRRNKRAAAGSMGGRAKANGLASANSHAKQMASKSVADTDTDTDTDEEAKASSIPAKRGTRIPPDFAVAPAMVAWARANTPTVDGQRETLKFINYYQALAGTKGVKLDWPATWRNWMLNAAGRAPQRMDQQKQDQLQIGA